MLMKSLELADTVVYTKLWSSYYAQNFLANWRVDYSIAMSESCSDLIYTPNRTALWGTKSLYVHSF